MKRSISQQSMNPPDGMTQRPAFLRTLSIEPDSPATPGLAIDDDPAGKSPRDRRPFGWGRGKRSPKGLPASPAGVAGHPRTWPYVLVTALVAGLLLIAHVGVSGELSSTKAEVARLTEALRHHEEPSPALRGSAPSPTARRHLVMACAVDAKHLDFQRFVYSLRLEARYAGDAALFVREDNVLPWLKEAVDVVTVEHTMKCPSDPKRTCVEDKAWGPVPVSLARFRYFHDYLEAHEPYDAVLWTSFTDTFFQRDPFSPPPFSELIEERKLVMFAEHPARPLLRQVYTMNAIHECYGLGKLEEFVNGETPALTAEALLGAGSAVKSYLGLLLFHVEACVEINQCVGCILSAMTRPCWLRRVVANQHRHAIEQVEAYFPKSKTCATSLSADQGHHNVVAFSKLPRDLFRIAAYNTGQVFVAGHTKLAKEKIKRDKDGYVLGADDMRVPVVLQYSSFDFLNDKAKAIVEAHAKEAAERWSK